jgi:hypothetical protein
MRAVPDQAVEHGLGLGVDPVEVLEDHAHGLHATLPEQCPRHRVVRLPPALRGIQGLPAAILDLDVEQ